MQQRILVRLGTVIANTMEMSNCSLGEHSQLEGILSTCSRAAGGQPNDLVLYEERQGDGESVVRVGVRGRDGICVPFEQSIEDNGGLNSVPPIRPEAWKAVPRDEEGQPATT